MTSKEIEANLQNLIVNLNNKEFIYDLLLAYGISKSSVNRLKKGDFNFSKIAGEVLYKNKLFFAYAEHDINLKVDQFASDERILKHNPRFIIVTDYNTLVAKDLKTKLNRDFPLKDLPKYFDFFLPLTGAEVYKSPNDLKADRDAAYKMAQLYDILVQDNPDYKEESHKLNIFLSRLLFCFFAEDTGIFKKSSIFTETLSQHTNPDGKDVDEFLNSFFSRLNTENGSFPDYLQNQFPYVNGGLFRDNITSPKFSTKSRTLLLSCGDLDWSEINPDIFGSMIQAVADPEERSDLGMHYTSVPNIKKLIEPLFLDSLIEEFDKIQDNISGLNKLIARLGKIKFFDPACGSGNFLIITYKEIRLLEIEIIKRIIELSSQKGLTIPLQFTNIKLSQFYGIEIKDFAHEMAILSLWLAEHQMNKVFDERLEGYGQSKPILPLKEAGNVFCDNATRINWEIVCPIKEQDEVYILGNPPYLGGKSQNKIQKEDMKFSFGGDKKIGELDYIASWFIKASNYIKNIASFAFVTTNSICQGSQVQQLWPKIYSNKQEIFFAYDPFKWTNNAKNNAGVTVTIIGIRHISNRDKYIISEKIKRNVNNISPYITNGSNSIVVQSLQPISKLPQMLTGNSPYDGGGLLVSDDEKNEIVNKSPSIAFFFKRIHGSNDFINHEIRWCIWINDKNLEEAIKYPFIKERIEKTLDFRKNGGDVARGLINRPHQFRYTHEAKSHLIIIPRVSSERRKYIPFGVLSSDFIVSDSAQVIYDADTYVFGILSSYMHMVWVRITCGYLGSSIRYSSGLCYNTFPFPDINVKQKETITQYVFDVLDERAKYPEKTMAWLYNTETMPSGLANAHNALDEAIERIYRLAPFTSDAERLAHLFKLYEEMAKKDTLFAKEKKVGKKK